MIMIPDSESFFNYAQNYSTSYPSESLQMPTSQNEQNFSPLAIFLLVVASLDTIALTAVYIYYFHILETKFPTTLAVQPAPLTSEIEETQKSEEKSVDQEQPTFQSEKVHSFSSSESVVADLRPFNASVIGNYRPRSTILPSKYSNRFGKRI